MNNTVIEILDYLTDLTLPPPTTLIFSISCL